MKMQNLPDSAGSAFQGGPTRAQKTIFNPKETGPLRAGEGIIMQETHRKAAELHELAAKNHRTAAEHNEKGDYAAAVWHSERALEYSDQALKLAKEAHTRSGQIVSL